jgi:hypothetical protein
MAAALDPLIFFVNGGVGDQVFAMSRLEGFRIA